MDAIADGVARWEPDKGIGSIEITRSSPTSVTAASSTCSRRTQRAPTDVEIMVHTLRLVIQNYTEICTLIASLTNIAPSLLIVS